MYKRGSNGAAHALIDARVLAETLKTPEERVVAQKTYENARLATTAKVVQTNRQTPPDFVNIKVEELTGDRPFDDLDKFISQSELRALSDNYKRIGGFGREDLV